MKSGIYKITNIVNGKIYIGSSQDIHKRLIQHKSRLQRNVHHSIHLQRSYNKHGVGAFIFETFLSCPVDELLQIEQYLLDFYQPKYNINPSAGSNRGSKRSEEFKQKIRETRLGTKASEETKQKMSMIRMGIPNIGSRKQVLQICRRTFTVLNIYDSITIAEASCGKYIGGVLNGKHNTAGGYIWRYADDPQYSQKV